MFVEVQKFGHHLSFIFKVCKKRAHTHTAQIKEIYCKIFTVYIPSTLGFLNFAVKDILY